MTEHPAALLVLQAGTLSTVQDLGRPGLAHLGIGHSGACDGAAIRLANRIVGNHESAAALELTYGGLVARFDGGAVIALTGARAVATVNGRQRSFFEPIQVAPGTELHVGVPPQGIRSYLAIRGGIDVPQTLGSRATDTLAHLGPPALRTGDRLPLGQDTAGPVTTLGVVPTVDPDPNPRLTVVPGPRPEWFADQALETLTTAVWRVSTESNRIGARLIGPVLQRVTRGELPSEGLIAGAIQVPPTGQPILFLADHPTTGGYPVIAVLAEQSITAAAQLRLGQQLRFRLDHTSTTQTPSSGRLPGGNR